eukprot:5038730-Prymnesium_polylepis.1
MSGWDNLEGTIVRTRAVQVRAWSKTRNCEINPPPRGLDRVTGKCRTLHSHYVQLFSCTTVQLAEGIPTVRT